MLQNINLSLGEGGYSKTTKGRGAEGTGAIPKIPGQDATHEDFLARGYGLAGEADGWASAIARANQAHGYARSESASRNKNRKMSAEDRKSALGESKLALDQATLDAGKPGRESEVEARNAATEALKLDTEIMNSLTPGEQKQIKLGGNSARVQMQKKYAEIAADAAELEAMKGLMTYDEAYQDIMGGLMEGYDNRAKGMKRIVTTPGKEKVSHWYGDEPAVKQKSEWFTP
jgi:hypothetical protein